jgi:hypothetical protein
VLHVVAFDGQDGADLQYALGVAVLADVALDRLLRGHADLLEVLAHRHVELVAFHSFLPHSSTTFAVG